MSTQIQKNKGTVRYAFKDSNNVLERQKNKESLIYLYFTFGSNRLKYSVGYKSCFAHWDFGKQRIKNISSLTNKDKVNQDLNSFEYKILDRYKQLYMDYGDSIDSSMIKNELDIIVRKKGLSSDVKIAPLTFIEVCEKSVTIKGTSIAPSTKSAYNQAIDVLKRYELKTKVPLTFDAIDMTFYYSFKAFMESENFSLNTFGKHIKSIKTFMNFAVMDGYTSNLKHNSAGFIAISEITTQIYLTVKEIAQMRKKNFSKFPILQQVRDIFLIGYFTGQRVSDYNNFSMNDIITLDGVQYFKFVQGKNRKSGKQVHCPITDEIREIMDKRYGGLLPPPLRDQDINEHLKDIGFALKLKEPIKCEYTKGGKLITKMIPKYKLLKSHTARRSFCTNKYIEEMSVFNIMYFSGHSSEKEFYKYIRIKEESLAHHIVKTGKHFNVTAKHI